MLDDDMYRCRACGFLQDEPPWGLHGDTPTFDICVCCGVEFGYGDCLAAAARRWRDRWLAAGARWKEPSEQPAGWSLDEQLSHVPAPFR